MNITDGLNLLTREEVGLAAFKLVNILQDEKPPVQLAATAALFVVMMEVFGTDPREELARAERVMKDADKNWNYMFNSIRAYIEGELKRGGN